MYIFKLSLWAKIHTYFVKQKKRLRELRVIIFATVINNAQNAYIYYDIVTRLKALFG
jgi:hypothetical protein